jgi:serine/threonine protein kinase
MPSGSRIGDFELLDVLGEGACGFVYLARQTTLARFVALKVSNLVASESRTLAMLEHDHIVQVFSEAVDWQRGMRLLCMQLVPGTTLGKVIRYWQQSGSDFGQRSGAALLTAVESLSPDWLPIAQPSLRDRDQLMRSDPVDTVAWLGARLAEALEHAHGYQVLHRDVKPENILISRLGRPYLADFHLAGGQAPGDAAVVGGSPRYMAPEHLKAMAAGAHGEGTTVDQRADIYALGLVLFELLSMRLPVGEGLPARLTIPQLADLAAARQRPVVVQDLLPDAAREAMGPVLERCLDANPEQRYPRAADLAADLDAARQWNQMMHRLPSAGRLTHLVAHWPVLALICAAVLPNLLGSAVNILYNGLCILPRLAAADHPLFYRLVTSYNAVAYPLCLAILLWRSAPVIRQLRRTDRRAGDRGRRDAARLSTWVAGVSLLGWLPGAILFPLVLQITASNISRPTLGHLAVDFCISGLVAATYSYFLVEMIVLRVIYPRFLRGAHHPAQTAQIDLVGAQRRLYLGQTLAGVIPLTGAVLLMVAGPAESPTADSFRWLVCGLIGAGIVGFCLAVTLASRLVQMIGALTGR